MSNKKPTWRNGGPYGTRNITPRERMVLIAEYARGIGRHKLHANFSHGFKYGEINIIFLDSELPPKEWRFQLLTRYESPQRELGTFASAVGVAQERVAYMYRHNLEEQRIRDGRWVSSFGIGPSSHAYYDEYIDSDAWKEKRQLKLSQSGGTCELCGTEDSIQIHHKTYKHLGNEPLDDLMVLCRECHCLVHSLPYSHRKAIE